MRDMASIQDITYAPLFIATEVTILLLSENNLNIPTNFSPTTKLHQQITLPYSVTRPIKYLQILMSYYKQVFVGGAAGGAIILFLKLAVLK